MRFLFGCAVLMLVACTSTGVVPADGDTFMIGKKSAAFGIGPPIKTEAAVFEEANEFCDGQGKEVETADLIVRNAVFGRQGSVNLKFRCVESGTSTAYAAATGTPSDSNATVNTGSDSASNRDKYTDLERLKQLLDDGALTQQEYDNEKAKILDD